MRLVITFFIALLVIPLAQVAVDRWIERPGPQVLGSHTGGLFIAGSKHHRSKDLEYLMVPKSERRPKTS
jgi:hypothetical protein